MNDYELLAVLCSPTLTVEEAIVDAGVYNAAAEVWIKAVEDAGGSTAVNDDSLGDENYSSSSSSSSI